MGPMGGGPPMAPGGAANKKEGPAEAAPKDKKALRPIQEVPAEPQSRRRVQFFELHGYMRMRADLFQKLNLGMAPDNNLTGADPALQYFQPPAQTDELDPSTGDYQPNQANCFAQLSYQGVNALKQNQRCARRQGISSANMRLRLQPTIHVTDSVKVHMTLDALDNLVLGSTPDSFAGASPWAPIDMYSRTQVSPTPGLNSFQDSISVKHAYGQIRFGWGLDLKFGRMPNHWGMGIVANDGMGYHRLERGDIVRMLDTDYGDTVDSVKFSYDFGKDARNAHTLSVSYDWVSTGPTTSQLFGPQWMSGNKVGQDLSAERFDNVNQFSISIARRDAPDVLRRKISTGVAVVNYGMMNWIRFQKLDRAIGSPGIGDGLGNNGNVDLGDGLGRPGAPLSNGQDDVGGEDGFQNYANLLVQRRAAVWTPDLWLRVNWRTLRFEAELAGVLGRFRHRDLGVLPTDPAFDLDRALATQRTKIQQIGYALEFKYGLFDDKFHLGFDHGFSSGDASAAVGYDSMNPFAQQGGAAGSDPGNTDAILRTFRFNPAYMQDLLLFREVLGTAANASYFRPWAAFYFFKGYASARLDLQYALAANPLATIGNRYSYGVELDGALRYHDPRHPIFAQLQYGVLFPFKAFDRADGFAVQPADGDAKAAQTVQAQIGIRF